MAMGMTDADGRVGELTPRQRAIIDQLSHQGFISTVDLAARFEVSDMTIRRDAKRIAAAGHARVVHGGISAVNTGGHSAFFAARTREHSAGKRRIAHACMRLFTDTDAIFLDAGTSTYEIATQLSPGFAGSIITNSLPAVQQAMRLGQARTISLGGMLLTDSQAFTGPLTVASLAGLRAAIAFIGVSGLYDGGFYIEREYERETKLAAMSAADRVAVLATHDKMNRSALAHLAGFAAADYVVTDAQPPAAVVSALAAAGTALIVAA